MLIGNHVIRKRYIVVIGIICVSFFLYPSGVLWIQMVAEKIKYDFGSDNNLFITPLDPMLLDGNGCDKIPGVLYKFDNLEILLPPEDVVSDDIVIHKDVPFMLKNSEEVLMSLIYSSLNGDIFIGGQGNIEDKKYMELTNDLGEKNKFEILKAILLSSPENINYFDSPIEQFFINIKLKIKDGLIPEDAKYINEFSNEYGVDGMLIGVQDDIYIIFIYEKSSDLLYQMVSKGRMFSQVQCLVRGIKHVDLRPEPR